MVSHRPRNRKELIRSTAADLFLARGYHNVSVNDVADALGIAPSALYHHYRGKQELLFDAVLDALERVDGVIGRATDLGEALDALTALVLTPGRSLAVWDREARHLDADQRAAVRAREDGVVGHLVPLIATAHPEPADPDGMLRARALVAVLGSRSSHRDRLSRRADAQLMARLAQAVVECPFTESEGDVLMAATDAPQFPRRRRDEILAAAIRLFDERGYQSVTLADIGEATGIVATGVYRHFSNKTAILVTALDRGGQRVREDVDRALLLADDPDERLAALIRAHIAVSIDERHLIGILTNEADMLPDEDRRALRRFERDYLDLWVQTLRAASLQDPDPKELRVIAYALQTMITFVVRRSEALPPTLLESRLRDLAFAVTATGVSVASGSNATTA